MEYQKIVEHIREREDFFARFSGGWPGHYGPASSKYPNLAAELAARDWDIETPASAAAVSRAVLAGVIEDNDLLEDCELCRIANRLGVSYRYLCSPILSYVDPLTKKGRRRAASLRRALKTARELGLWGAYISNAVITLQLLERSETVTYAAWRVACEKIEQEAVQLRNEMKLRCFVRTNRMVAG